MGLALLSSSQIAMNMIGPKMSAALATRRHDGGCGTFPRPRWRVAGCFLPPRAARAACLLLASPDGTSLPSASM